ncbi:pentapeptide repeat-containing protein [Microtetraspora fusca]|uniref:pentapeptide repeat-containing protein n=1 Tax=Microtetraspora fusca TaxID=1997 RepID=UPI000B00A3B0|nr:pentapeptide repeat-containing protein [Microtetraspora fusca]
MRRFRALSVVLAIAAIALPIPLGAAAAGADTAALSAGCRPGSGPDMRGEDFSGADDLPLNLRCANLTGATLDGADLTSRDMRGVILRDASLREADLTLAHAEGVDLRGADLSGADLGQLHGRQAQLRGANLKDAYAGQADLSRADLTGAILARTELTQADLTGTTFVGAELSKAILGQVKARTADFTRATMRGTKLGQAHLESAVFAAADLGGATLTQAEMEGADLTGANVEGASFGQARDVNLAGSRGIPAVAPTTLPSPSPSDDRSLDAADRAIAEDPVRTTTGLLLVVLSGIGLAITLLFWAAAHRRGKRDAAAFELERQVLAEDLSQLGDEINTMDAELRRGDDGTPTEPGDQREWRAALDAYEAARHVLTVARTPGELQGAVSAVEHGRASLRRVRTRLSDHGGQR